MDKFWDKIRIIRHGRAFLVFIVGLQEDKVADLEEESDQNGDLVITEHLDSYNNLTLKTMAAFDWMLTFCPQTEYLLKTDDDMFIQVRFIYSRAPSCTASSCKDLRDARFWIRSKKIWNGRSCTFFHIFARFLINEYLRYTFFW